MIGMKENRKSKYKQGQIIKSLELIKSPKELKSILKSSSEQNKKLVNQVKQLRDRIQIIMSSRRIVEDESVAKPSNEAEASLVRQIQQNKKQLKSRYAKMKQLKQQLDNRSNSKIEQSQFNKIQNMNNLTVAQKAIKQLKKQLEDLKQMHKKLEKTIESNKKQENVNQPRIQQIQDENKSLKLKIAQLRKADYEHEYESIKVQTTLVINRTKARENSGRKSMFDIKNMKTLQKKQLISQEQLNLLIKQVSTLKKQVVSKQESDKLELLQLKKKKDDLIYKNREAIKRMKQVQLQKCKVQQQSNMWRKKWNDICRAIQLHKNKIKKISVEIQAQEFVDLKPLRRDYAGILNKYKFDDRLILKQNKSTKIIGMMIYQIERGIVTIQAFYDNGERTYMPIPQHFIERCRVTKIECSEGDFFKLFKIKYNCFDNKITKLQVRSNKNIKYQYGQKKQWSDLNEGDTVYGFDIGIKQYPVSIFGSYNYFKGNWLLQGFGVEINELTE